MGYKLLLSSNILPTLTFLPSPPLRGRGVEGIGVNLRHGYLGVRLYFFPGWQNMLESVGSAVLYPEGVTLPSPGSRSAPWDQVEPPASTPKGLHSTAQGRAAHPGEEIPQYVYPERVVQPFQGRGGWVDLVPGCAARPWAGECNPFGVKNGTTNALQNILPAWFFWG